MELKEGDLVLCTVDKIVKTTVFVKIEDNGEGTIVTSEIASGRIRNMRDYVMPRKKIVCKILRIDESGNISLSLRRVTGKETKEVMESYERERNAISIIRSVVKEKAEELAEKLKKEGSIYDFLQNCRLKPEKLEQYFERDEAERICKILQEKKEKKVEVKKEFKLSSKKPDGIRIIREILSSGKCDITYLTAGRFSIKATAPDYKEANAEINKALAEIERLAKEKKAEFEIKKS